MQILSRKGEIFQPSQTFVTLSHLPLPRPAGCFPFYVWLKEKAAFYRHLDNRGSEIWHTFKENQGNTRWTSSFPYLVVRCSNWNFYCMLSLPDSVHSKSSLAGVHGRIRYHSSCWTVLTNLAINFTDKERQPVKGHLYSLATAVKSQ